ncbi:MAG: DUF3054 domain-containing protein [Desertimonas sp.]
MTAVADPPADTLGRQRVLIPLLLDTIAVLVFVVVGRDEHQQTSTVADVLTVSAPFLIGVAGGAAVAVLARRPLRSLAAGGIVTVSTIVVGMLLRRFVWDRGTALTFIVVTSAFLAVCFLGWRAVGASLRRLGYSRQIRAPRT